MVAGDTYVQCGRTRMSRFCKMTHELLIISSSKSKQLIFGRVWAAVTNLLQSTQSSLTATAKTKIRSSFWEFCAAKTLKNQAPRDQIVFHRANYRDLRRASGQKNNNVHADFSEKSLPENKRQCV